MQPLYRIILKKAWDITKKYKFLWFFGVFALWLGNGGEMQIFFRTLYAVEDLSFSKIPEFINSFLLLDFIKNATNINSVLIWVAFILIELILLFFIAWIVTTSQSSIIKSADNISNGKVVKFGEQFKESQKYFFPVLGFNIISEVLISLLVFLLIIPLLLVIAMGGLKFKFLVGVIVFVVFLPIAVIISFVMRYAINFVIVKGEKFASAFSKAWILFKTNWLISLEMAFALLIINTLIGIVVIYITMIIIGPFFSSDLLATFTTNGGMLKMVLFRLLPLAILFILVGAGIAVFQIVSWTLLFNELVESKRYSKLVRIIASLSSYTKTKNQIFKTSDLEKLPKEDSIVMKRRTGRPKTAKSIKKTKITKKT